MYKVKPKLQIGEYDILVKNENGELQYVKRVGKIWKSVGLVLQHNNDGTYTITHLHTGKFIISNIPFEYQAIDFMMKLRHICRNWHNVNERNMWLRSKVFDLRKQLEVSNETKT